MGTGLADGPRSRAASRRRSCFRFCRRGSGRRQAGWGWKARGRGRSPVLLLGQAVDHHQRTQPVKPHCMERGEYVPPSCASPENPTVHKTRRNLARVEPRIFVFDMYISALAPRPPLAEIRNQLEVQEPELQTRSRGTFAARPRPLPATRTSPVDSCRVLSRSYHYCATLRGLTQGNEWHSFVMYHLHLGATTYSSR